MQTDFEKRFREFYRLAKTIQINRNIKPIPKNIWDQFIQIKDKLKIKEITDV